MLAHLSRYTHRVAISNSRLLALDERGVTFRWKDYRVKDGAKEGAKGQTRRKVMTLSSEEFMRRFLLHVLPGSFHRMRHYGLLANGNRKTNLALARELLSVPAQASTDQASRDSGDDGASAPAPTFASPHCGHAMIILQTFTRGQSIRAPPPP